MKRAWLWSLFLALVLPVAAGATAEVVATDWPPRIDGVLEEWGVAQWMPIAPGGENVGVRGAFAGAQDHQVDVYLMWDADFLYAAVVVVDDVTDVGRVSPAEHVWQGPSGERKDKMFYYDHLKVFLRGPEAPLGHNAWFAPTDGEQDPYRWGGRQLSPGSANIRVEVGSAWREGTYTYELAFPWKWLEIYPQSGIELDAMFLLPDSDFPGLEIRKKVHKSNKWIWWKGKLQLTGTPPGLKPPPKPVVVQEIERQAQAIVLPKPKPKPEPPPKPAAEDGKPAAKKAAPAVSHAGERAESESESRAENAQVAAAAPVASMRARLQRQLLARYQIPAAPAWVRALNEDPDVSETQVDSLFRRLTTNLYRLADSGIDSRTDGLVMDMAEYAGTWRAQARDLLVKVLAIVVEDVRGEGKLVQAKIAQAAVETGIEEGKASRLVEDICAQALKVYQEGKVSTTGDLLQKARRKAGLSAEEMRGLLRGLVRDWGE